MTTRIAVISDIHANAEALTAVLRDLRRFDPVAVVSLGDVVGYNSQPRETIALLRAAGVPGVHGNHDLMVIGRLDGDRCGPWAVRAARWTAGLLSADERAYLAELPGALRLRTLIFLHSCLGDPVRRLSALHDYVEQYRALKRLDADLGICFTGHTHVAQVVAVRGETETHLRRSQAVKLDPSAFYFINPGSVGLAQGGDERASYALFDLDQWHVTFRRVPYHAERLRRLNAAHGIGVAPGDGRSPLWARSLGSAARIMLERTADTMRRGGSAVRRDVRRSVVRVGAAVPRLMRRLRCVARRAVRREAPAPSPGAPQAPGGTRLTVLVTGADAHQGLAAIRGLGQAGVDVVACGAGRLGVGFSSRYATARYRYRQPLNDPGGFVADMLDIVARSRPDVVVPVLESTLVLLDRVRDDIERWTRLAAPAHEALDYAVDKLKTVQLAHELGVPVPTTAHGMTVEELLARAARLRFPVAIKPRGHGCYGPTAHRLPFKVLYARSLDELQEIVARAGPEARALLVQEYARGVGRCVAGVWDDGIPLALIAYERLRELPLTGGISVMRRTIPMDPRMCGYAAALLQRLRWRGPAMVEFKFDAEHDRYLLMEVNPRLQASTALSVDAGVNIPYLSAALFAGRRVAGSQRYRVGVEERWLRGDVEALLAAFTPRWCRRAGASLAGTVVPERRVVREFMRDFRRGVRYDEFRRGDWRPGVVAGARLAASVLRWVWHVGRDTVRVVCNAVRCKLGTRRVGRMVHAAQSLARHNSLP